MSRNKTIAKNTLALYFRQILIMLVSLYTVRIVLKALGVEDYGIYNVVAGIVSMLSFLSGSLAGASQRFFSYDIGQNNTPALKKSFGISLALFLFLTLVVVVLAETVGLWFVSHKIVIPLNRSAAVFWAYQSAVFAVLSTIITTPFIAMIVAREKLSAFALFGVFEALLRLLIAYLVVAYNGDKLIYFSLLMMIATILKSALYVLYALRMFSECRSRPYFEKEPSMKMLSFTGLIFIETMSITAQNHGGNILLNLFFGPAVNAARAVAIQVYQGVMSFVTNFATAFQPQIVKRYSSGNVDDMLSLVFRSSKASFYLFLIFGATILLNCEEIIKLWLGTPPAAAVVFTQLFLFDAMINSASISFRAAIQATGNIKLLQISSSITTFLNLPLSYIALKFGAAPTSVLYISIGLSTVVFFIRVYLAHEQFGFQLSSFANNVLKQLLLVLFFTLAPMYLVQSHLHLELTLITSLLVPVVWTLVIVFLLGLSTNERRMIINSLHNQIHKIKIVKMFS